MIQVGWENDEYATYNPLEGIENKNILRSAFTVIGKSKKVKNNLD